MDEVDVPGRPLDWLVIVGNGLWYWWENVLERFVTLDVGECARDAAELLAVAAWNGDQNVVEESMVWTGEDTPK